WKRFDTYGKELGEKIRPYDLRHSFALNYLRQGGNAFGLQRTLGHSSMAMTRRYVNLTQLDLKQLHSTASPLKKLLLRQGRVRKLNRWRRGLMTLCRKREK
ncbi:MAG: tyrosine-type recombinase/integrase, partial [Bacillota bacterium]|nr:tyrosine-type recombinase/integrase [Bacillota bacterium]